MKGFRQCEICGSNRWEIVYQGDIRDGAYGNFVANAIVAKCLNCSIERLEESFCPNENIFPLMVNAVVPPVVKGAVIPIAILLLK